MYKKIEVAKEYSKFVIIKKNYSIYKIKYKNVFIFIIKNKGKQFSKKINIR